MTTVGVADLKAKLSRYLALAAAGEEILVTDRGKPLARVTGAGAEPGSQDAELLELERVGLLRGPIRALPDDFWEGTVPEDPSGSVLSALIEERRGDR